MSTEYSNPYFDAWMQCGGGRMNGIMFRDDLVKRYAWAVPTHKAAMMIAGYRNSIVEIGAGTGYWAWFLHQYGIHVVAYDQKPYKNRYVEGQHYPVLKGGATKSKLFPDRALMLVWPPYSDGCAYRALKAYAGDTLFFVGEGKGGCTADDRFFDLLDAEWTELEYMPLPQWFGIHDYLIIYRRNG